MAGAGAGTVSAWLAEQVGEEGEVWSCDIDLQFHDPMPANVKVLQHDHTKDDLPEAISLSFMPVQCCSIFLSGMRCWTSSLLLWRRAVL